MLKWSTNNTSRRGASNTVSGSDHNVLTWRTVMAENHPSKSSVLQSKHDLAGQRFGRLTVLEYAGYRQKSRSHMWQCACDCGGQITTQERFLLKGGCRSCGCVRREKLSRLGRSMATHGDSRVGKHSPEYECWSRIKARCHRLSHHHYGLYGGRGIQVCERWRNSFEAFLADVGRRPGPEYSLDRINTDGHYEPGNVRWATQTQQCRNRRNNRLLTFRGEIATLAEWAERSDIDQSTVGYRLRAGWPVERALTQEVRKHK